MFTLKKSFRFEASHRLMLHDGKCSRLHGHSWQITIEIRSPFLITEGPKKNMALDYGDISRVVKPLVEMLDHSHLNDVFGVDMPTSEYLAEWLFNRILPQIPELSAVTINETCTSECRYDRDEIILGQKGETHEGE